MIVECANCGKEFNRKPSQKKDKNYCSKECWYSSDENKNRPERKTGKYKNCEVCGKEFYVQKSRLDVRKYCSKECMYEGLKVKRVCENCGDKFWQSGGMRGSRKYCSKKCSQEASKSGRIVECEQCGKEVYKRKCFLEKADHYFCSIECQTEWQGRNKVEFECEVCGEEFKLPKSRAENENPRFCSIECRDGSDDWGDNKGGLTTAEISFPTSLELKGRELLEEFGFEKGIDFQERVTINDKFNVDVFFEDKELIIEWDGDYWHGHPSEEPLNEHQKYVQNRDYSQKKYMEKCGYTTLRFWGSEVRNKREKVKNEIKDVIGC